MEMTSIKYRDQLGYGEVYGRVIDITMFYFMRHEPAVNPVILICDGVWQLGANIVRFNID